MKWDHLLANTSIPGPDSAQSIIDRWNPFNKRDTSVTDIHELYPTNLQIPVVALSKEYFIPFPDYMDKKFYQRVAEDGMYIRNQDFNETARSKHWERKAKEGIESIIGMEKKRDEAKKEAQITGLATIVVGDAKTWAEDDLARVQDTLVIAEEARHKTEVEVASLEFERTSLQLEVVATKDEVTSFQSQAGKDKAAMEEDYQKALEQIFAYGYRCCIFAYRRHARFL